MSGFIPMVKPTGRCFGSRSKTERSIDSKHDSLNDATFLARHAVRFLAKNLRPNVIVNITYWREAPHVSEERPIGRGRAHHAVLGFDHGAEVSSATLAGRVDADAPS